MLVTKNGCIPKLHMDQRFPKNIWNQAVWPYLLGNKHYSEKYCHVHWSITVLVTKIGCIPKIHMDQWFPKNIWNQAVWPYLLYNKQTSEIGEHYVFIYITQKTYCFIKAGGSVFQLWFIFNVVLFFLYFELC